MDKRATSGDLKWGEGIGLGVSVVASGIDSADD